MISFFADFGGNIFKSISHIGTPTVVSSDLEYSKILKNERFKESRVGFKKFEDNPEDPEILQQLQTHLNAERYLRRLLDRIPAID